MDDLNPTQFDLLVPVLSRSSSERNFKLLLSPKNIWKLIDNLEDFVPQKVLRLNFMGSGNAQAREQV